MFSKLGHFVVRHRKAILIAYVAFVIASFAGGAQVFNHLQTQGYDDPHSTSARVDELLKSDFHVRETSVVVIVDTTSGVDEPSVASEANVILDRISALPHVSSVVSYWSTGGLPTLRSVDGKAALASVYFEDSISPSDAADLAGQIQDTFDGPSSIGRTYISGLQTVYHSINGRIQSDLAKAESIAIPLNILMLLVVFGTVIASGLPMIVALAAVSGTMLTLYLFSLVTDVSVFAMNLVTGLGLGLGIDYALLVVSRFREEIHRDATVENAVVRTVASAGRTVWFSGITVMLVLASMQIFPLYFLRSFAYAGVCVVLFAVIATLLPLPALLSVVGTRIDKWRVRRGATEHKDDGAWAWLARTVMKRPWPIIIVTIAALGLVASPALHTSYGQVDERVLQSSEKVAIAGEVARTRFAAQQATPIEIVIPKATATVAVVNDFARLIAPLPHVVSIDTPDKSYAQGAWTIPMSPPAGQESADFFRVSVTSDSGPRDTKSVQLVEAIRTLQSPAGTMVGGASAIYSDALHGISSRLPALLAWLALATLIVLFLFTGSVLLPIKAVVLNVLSLSATLGLMTWVFQSGHLQWLVGDFTLTGSLDTSTIVLVAVVTFGLSMDYEVFMLSRIKEEHDRGASTVDAVSFGLQRSGRIITAAAVLIAVVFATFITSGVTSIKMLGLGTAFAIMLDATVVRGLLVPALMRVAGKWNWWAPAPLRAVYSRFGVRD